MRVELDGGESFEQLLAKIREISVEAYAHQELPFDKLVADLAPARDLGRNPLVQVTFALQNARATASWARPRCRSPTGCRSIAAAPSSIWKSI